MIGLSQIKKKVYTGLAIGLGIGAVTTIAAVVWATLTIKSYENETNTKYVSEYMTDVTVLKRDVSQGELITSDIVEVKKVRKTAVPTGLASGISGMVAKYNIPANLPVTASMVDAELVNSDIRSQEVNTVLIPSDLVTGQYVDIRIMFPNGTDYIVLAQKKVEKIIGQTIWLMLSEDERILLNGAMVDSFLNDGSKLYATSYVSESQTVKLDFGVIQGTDTTGEGTANPNNDNLTDSQKASNIVKGYINNAITSALPSLRSDDSNLVASTVLDLIVKYRNFSSIATRTIENYQPNKQVIDMMGANANIINEARAKLSKDIRSNIENANSQYESESGDNYSNVVSGADESITNQQTQRTALLNGEI